MRYKKKKEKRKKNHMILTSREAAKRPYKKRMECDQAKMISRRLKEVLATAKRRQLYQRDTRLAWKGAYRMGEGRGKKKSRWTESTPRVD
jgi:hypothetical protein